VPLVQLCCLCPPLPPLTEAGALLPSLLATLLPYRCCSAGCAWATATTTTTGRRAGKDRQFCTLHYTAAFLPGDFRCRACLRFATGPPSALLSHYCRVPNRLLAGRGRRTTPGRCLPLRFWLALPPRDALAAPRARCRRAANIELALRRPAAACHLPRSGVTLRRWTASEQRCRADVTAGLRLPPIRAVSLPRCRCAPRGLSRDACRAPSPPRGRDARPPPARRLRRVRLTTFLSSAFVANSVVLSGRFLCWYVACNAASTMVDAFCRRCCIIAGGYSSRLFRNAPRFAS